MLKIHKSVGAPDLLTQFFPRYQLCRAAGKQGEDFERLWRQAQENSRLPQLTGFEVQLEDPEARSRVCRFQTDIRHPAQAAVLCRSILHATKKVGNGRDAGIILRRIFRLPTAACSVG